MSQPDDPRSELGMRYFTPELVLELNSPDSDAVDDAMERWEKAVRAYRKSVEKIQRQMPLHSRAIADLPLHDWNLVRVVQDAAGPVLSATIVLRHNDNLVILDYALTGKLQRIDSPRGWSLSKRRVHWLYDELDKVNDQGSFIHRVLFSDGTTLLVPFSTCRAMRVESNHAMSHSELMQIA